MKRTSAFAVVLAALFALAGPVLAEKADDFRAQNAERPRANHGRIPASPERREPTRAREVERVESGHSNDTPHVSNDRWYGHDEPGNARLHLDRPFEHGRFEHFGPDYRYGVVRIDRDLHRFWLPGGMFFEVAAWDWALATDWCWDCGEDFVVFEDPDHPGWYLLYNVQTGAYVHVNYMGQ